MAKWGCWKCSQRLRDLGHAWNPTRVHRVDGALRLHPVRRTKQRLPARVVAPLTAPAPLNNTWAMDCMGDTRSGARRDRPFNVIDEGHRDAVAIAINISLPSVRVLAVREQRVAMHGAPPSDAV